MPVTKDLPCWLKQIGVADEIPAQEAAWRLMKLNAQLETDARLCRMNESLLEERLNGLEAIGAIHEEAYGLTLVRITELGLLCAGNYADHGEVQGVGDFLFNPRRVRIHVRGMPNPVVKNRHMALTEQFAHVAPTKGDVVAWLRDETIIEIKQQALLPCLYERLCKLRVRSPEYLNSVRDRMTKIADLVGVMASGQFDNGRDFYQWLETAETADRQLIESKLCRFDTTIFLEMGRTLRQILELYCSQPVFLGEMDAIHAIG